MIGRNRLHHLCILVFLLISLAWTASATRISVDDTTVNPGGEASMVLKLDTITPGIAVYDISVNVTDPEKADILRVEYPVWATLSKEQDLPSGNAHLMVVNGGTAPSSDILLATVTIQGLSEGHTALGITVNELRNTKGENMPVTVTGGAIQVGGPAEYRNTSAETGSRTGNNSTGTTPAPSQRPSPGFSIVAVSAGLLGAAAFVRGRQPRS